MGQGFKVYSSSELYLQMAKGGRNDYRDLTTIRDFNRSKADFFEIFTFLT